MTGGSKLSKIHPKTKDDETGVPRGVTCYMSAHAFEIRTVWRHLPSQCHSGQSVHLPSSQGSRLVRRAISSSSDQHNQHISTSHQQSISRRTDETPVAPYPLPPTSYMYPPTMTLTRSNSSRRRRRSTVAASSAAASLLVTSLCLLDHPMASDTSLGGVNAFVPPCPRTHSSTLQNIE